MKTIQELIEAVPHDHECDRLSRFNAERLFEAVAEFCSVDRVLDHRGEVKVKLMNGLEGETSSTGFISGKPLLIDHEGF